MVEAPASRRGPPAPLVLALDSLKLQGAEIACWDGQVSRRALALPQLRAFLEEVWRSSKSQKM